MHRMRFVYRMHQIFFFHIFIRKKKFGTSYNRRVWAQDPSKDKIAKSDRLRCHNLATKAQQGSYRHEACSSPQMCVLQNGPGEGHRLQCSPLVNVVVPLFPKRPGDHPTTQFSSVYIKIDACYTGNCVSHVTVVTAVKHA
jgi:hypothetical protein